MHVALALAAPGSLGWCPGWHMIRCLYSTSKDVRSAFCVRPRSRELNGGDLVSTHPGNKPERRGSSDCPREARHSDEAASAFASVSTMFAAHLDCARPGALRGLSDRSHHLASPSRTGPRQPLVSGIIGDKTCQYAAFIPQRGSPSKSQCKAGASVASCQPRSQRTCLFLRGGSTCK